MLRHLPVVLSADDDEDGHFFLQRAFSQAGVEAVLRQVDDGEEVIKYLRGAEQYKDRTEFPVPDLVLLDLKMPRLTGFGVLEHLQGRREGGQYKVVIFSSSDHEKDQARARELGADGYLVKPTDFKKLVRIAQEIDAKYLRPASQEAARESALSKEAIAGGKHGEGAIRPEEERFSMINANDSPEMFKLLVDQVKDYAIFFLDAKGNISSWNQGALRIKGYSADEILGRHFSVFYTMEDLASEKPARELAIATREGRYEEEGWRLRKDGSRFWASVVITALRDKKGTLSGFAKVTRDLTQRKREEEALKARTEELEAFAHTLSHDLRAPLRSISSFADLLMHEGEGMEPEERQDYLKRIFQSSRSMEAMIQGILQLSQVSLGGFAEEAVALEEVMDESLQILEGDIKSSQAKVTVQKPLPIIKGNRTLLLQVFSNLIGNALKFVKAGGTPQVDIFAIPRGGNCEIHVKDHGPGIPNEQQRTIFNVFDRGSAASHQPGSGVGLAIVKRAVERLRGEVFVQSAQGEGADFIVRLPCHHEALAQTAA